MSKQDLTQYSSQELSLRVFNIESLYVMRTNRPALIEHLKEIYIFDDTQFSELITDLDDDMSETA